MTIYSYGLLKTKKGHSLDLRSFLIDLITQSRVELGCTRFDLHQSIEDEELFVLVEEWEDEYWLQRHRKQAYMKNFLTHSRPLLTEKAIFWLTERLN
ncbi:putative quinol monooxygenase [Mucilaginibacter aquaedulcis]|uniref:putative quinol monooxygenase n=1 Tax=Mucilaginibacter aquaedulcis TaxID=1187081 RepID=UPI0025B43B4A|nr:putative quinol monooxygenase [Mucilaginibacter aquaedulcis]MDN3549193.1 putative quinol monooxygenase [Mucilaginibacter aquaedulcis]